ncbi:phage tail protein [Brucella gallinifaecis]|uniref:phage tail protein n=1 Tax=Brucella gallinifaecis TaxID=215590 RepID=UPI00235EC541|nr:tail fiber protein [Brucella gallinifaecis]
MPFDSNGKYSLPPIYKATTGEKVLAEQHNTPLEDVAQALSQCLKRDGSTPVIRNLSFSGFLITDLGDAKNPGDAVSKKILDAAVPVGEFKSFAGDVPPQGWLLCYGQAVSRSVYAALFAVIGIKFGQGDGGSTFNVPDLRGRILVGRDDMGGTAANRVTTAVSGIDATKVGSVGGAQGVALTIDQLAEHDHSGKVIKGGKHKHNIPNMGLWTSDGSTSVRSWGQNGQVHSTDEGGEHDHEIPKQGKGEPHNNMPPSLITNWIIRTGV